MTDQDKYALTEAMRKACIEYGGDKWHKVTQKGTMSKCSCGKQFGAYSVENINHICRALDSGNDMVWLKEAIERKGEWDAFEDFAIDLWVDESRPTGRPRLAQWLLDPTRFAWLVAQAIEAGVLTC